MAKGVLYVMSSAVKGLIKIGKTGTDQFISRMNVLENNGYANVTHLERKFAIEVEDYDEKEQLLHDIFSKARVGNTELFALDIDLAIQLLTAFDGTQIFPKNNKEREFQKATQQRHETADAMRIPNGTYVLERTTRSGEKICAHMNVDDGTFTILTGERVIMAEGAGLSEPIRKLRQMYLDNAGIVTVNVQFDSPSTAGSFVIGRSCNGWDSWKTLDGNKINIFRETATRD